MIALLIITDGREDYLDECVASALASLRGGQLTERWMYDDTGDEAHRARLVVRYPTFTHIDGGPRQGFGGAIRVAWEQLAARSRADYVFHLEQDFTFNHNVPLDDMVKTLESNPHLVQLALRRQPWSAHEHEAGGVVEQHPTAYVECTGSYGEYLAHRLFFTTNPSLYRRTLCELKWPSGGRSEGRFTHQLLQDGSPEVSGDAVRFGYWGARDSGEWVTHIGVERHGTGY